MTPAKVLLCRGGHDGHDGKENPERKSSAAAPARRPFLQPRGAWARGIKKTLGSARLAALGGLLGLGLAGCDSDQNIVITVQAVPEGSKALGAYYSLDTRPGADDASGITQRLDQFAFKLPADYRGTLTTGVFAYRDSLPCIAGSGSGTLSLSGQYRQEQTIALANETSSGCTITKVPLALPPTTMAPLASWGDAPDNIWVVGDKGAILRWDGRVFRRVALPPALAAAPPTWRAVTGVGRDYVWFAGDKGAVARWNGTELQAVALVDSMNMPIDPKSASVPNWLGVAIADSGSDDVFFASDRNAIGRFYKTRFNGVAAIPITNGYQAYPPSGTNMIAFSGGISFADVSCIAKNECWFVGSDGTSRGFIMQAYSYATDGVYIYTDYSNSNQGASPPPLTVSRLQGIWTSFAVNTREIFIVGAKGALLYSNNSLLDGTIPAGTLYPVFNVICGGQGCMFSTNLNAIGGTGLADLWVAGDGGTLLDWNPAVMAPANPIVDMTSPALTANLSRIFSVGGRVFVSGDQQTFASPLISGGSR